MSAPEAVRYLRRCKWCSCVHDTGKVTGLARYADCSVWACPGCGVQIDDRPLGWGGSYPVEEPATSTVVQRCSNACYTNGICTCRKGSKAASCGDASPHDHHAYEGDEFCPGVPAPKGSDAVSTSNGHRDTEGPS